jgi:hypothetical protein
MKKFNEPIIFTIQDLTFLLDIDRQVLRQTDNPANEISFVRDMTDHGSHYSLFFDREGKNIPGDAAGVAGRVEIIVPKLIELDPEGMAAKYGWQVGDLAGKTDFEVIVDQQALQQRREGALPLIRIMGEEFYVDLRLHELRHAGTFHPVLSLESFELTVDGWQYEAYYHPVIRQLVPLDPQLTELPESVVKIRIPNEIGLDPVGAARLYNIDERTLLRLHPIKRDLRAEVIPLSETGIPALIARNRQELMRQHRENMKKLRPKIRRHL